MVERMNTLIFIFSFTSVACLLATINALHALSKGKQQILGWLVAIFLTGAVSIALLIGVLYAVASQMH
jgi:hypothetical protein